MGILSKRERNVIKQLRQKSEEINNDISKEIDEIYDEINQEYHQIEESIEDKFSEFINNVKSKLSQEESEKLEDFSKQFHKLNHATKMNLIAIRELARDQKKASRESLREYEEYLH